MKNEIKDKKNKPKPVKADAKPSAGSKAGKGSKSSPKAANSPTRKSVPKTVQESPVPVRAKSSSVRQQAQTNTAGRGKSSVKNVRKRKKPKYAASVKIFAAVLPVLLIAVVVAVNRDDLKYSNVSYFFKSVLYSFSAGKGYPYEIPSSDKSTVDLIGSGILMTDRDSVKVLNAAARETMSGQNTFSDTSVDVCNGRAILYDRESGGFRVAGRTGDLFNSKVSRNIFTAAIGKKGNFAVASGSKSATSELNVYDTSKVQIFTWLCEAERISAVALSDNGKSAAAAVVGAKDGELYSKLYIFDFDKKEPVLSFIYPETVLMKVRFTQKRTVTAVGDSLLSAVNLKTGEKQDVLFESSTLHRFDLNECGKTACVLAAFGSTLKNKLKVFSPDGELLFEKNLNGEVGWISCDKGHTSVLLGDKVQSYNNSGELSGTIKLDSDADKILLKGNAVYVVGGGKINRFTALDNGQ